MKVSNGLSLTALTYLFLPPAYSTFYIIGLVLSMQIPFVGFQPIRTSEHMAAAGQQTITCGLGGQWKISLEANNMCLLRAYDTNVRNVFLLYFKQH